MKVDKEEIERAYDLGEEQIHVWVMKCVGYDERYQRSVVEEPVGGDSSPQKTVPGKRGPPLPPREEDARESDGSPNSAENLDEDDQHAGPSRPTKKRRSCYSTDEN